MKVAYFILNNFDFDTRARLEVETLREMGLEVDVIATVGGSFDDFKGAKLHRLPQWRGPTRKFRFAQYNCLAASLGAKLKADVYHAIDLDVLLATYLASRRHRAPIVYEARELYTELEPLSGRRGAKAVWSFLERRLINKAARIITINDSIARVLCKRYGIEQPVIIRNVALLPENLRPVDLRALFDIPRGWRVMIYQGVLRHGQGLSYLVEIMRYLEKTALIFFGDGVIKPELLDQAARLNLSDRIKFGGRIDSDQLLNYTAGADAGLLLMEDVALNNRLALPQKLFQYLVAGVPQIVSPMAEIAAFVSSEKTGIVVTLDDSRIAAGDIAAFLSHDTAINAARENCVKSARLNNWRRESRRLVEIYEGLCQK